MTFNLTEKLEYTETALWEVWLQHYPLHTLFVMIELDRDTSQQTSQLLIAMFCHLGYCSEHTSTAPVIKLTAQRS